MIYGPFPPDGDGAPFPGPCRVRDDLARMVDIGVNAIRAYHIPPTWLLEEAEGHGVSVLVDIPWSKHLCFLDSPRHQAEARQVVHRAAERRAGRTAVLGYSIGNEISPDVVRWHGARRVERFLAELRDVVKQVDPEALVTYANYPPTEYLDLPFLDFAMFNVYLHDRETFRRYLIRLQNLVGDRPLVLGEIGMDTLRHGELAQAEFLRGHLCEATLTGLAGSFVFSWTDEWFTGGHIVEDWAFGVTYPDRTPKASYHALREVFGEDSLPALVPETPRVSVVVCSYNGGRTLDACLRSTRALDYPDYEVILIDDGSTDDTRAIAARFPEVRAVHQPNLGLSEARNVGLRMATGSVVAYTDSDCIVDPDWLSLLVYQLQRTGAAAVGGPNLSPKDGGVAACVAASPGQPTHVLESDQVAEHIPGCNMAYRREALLAISGFDPVYRRAGDDVDLCWRLQHAGMWISFAPGAFVWHHRRQTVRAYLRQQSGYGEAEALLKFKHPDKFNHRGDGKWRGVMYTNSLAGLRLGVPLIYRGVFATGMFQCLYRTAPAHWATLPSTLEWHFGLALLAALALLWPSAWGVVGAAFGLSLLVAALQAAQARLDPSHDRWSSRLLIAVLCYLQPLVRSWARYRTRLASTRTPRVRPLSARVPRWLLPGTGAKDAVYWSEEWRCRTELLDRVRRLLEIQGWDTVADTGWTAWDLKVGCSPLTQLLIRTAQEEHGGGRRLIRIRYRLRPSRAAWVLGSAAAAIGLALAYRNGAAALCWAIAMAVAVAQSWLRGIRQASRVVLHFADAADDLGLVHCRPEPPEAGPGPTASQGRGPVSGTPGLSIAQGEPLLSFEGAGDP